jgi:hypothetical protein
MLMATVIRIRLTRTFPAVLLMCLFGCRSYPAFAPHIGRRDSSLMAKEAPIVVVGIAKSISIAATCRMFDSTISAEKSESEWPLALKLVTLQVENVLKGLSDVHEVSFYRYEWCGDYIRNGTPEGNRIDTDSRSVYFLRWEQNSLRAFNDYTYTRLPIWSGRHETNDIQGNSIEERLVWLMMTPGDNMNRETFAETLRSQVLWGYGLEAQHRMFRRLLHLLDDSDALVRTGACLALAWNFSGRYSCLSQPYITAAPTSLSWAIQGARTFGQEREDGLKKIFLANPWKWVRRDSDLCDELDILSLHEDPRIARIARSILAQEFPDYNQVGCKGT